MKVRLHIFLLLAILLTSIASAESLFDYRSLTLDLKITNKFEIVGSGSTPGVQKLVADLTWYPKDDARQKVEFVSTTPGSEFREGTGFLFTWNQPSQRSFEIIEESRLTTSGEIYPIRKKIMFPLRDLEPGYSQYLEPGEIIDVNDDIKALASRLAEGENDEYMVVAKLAEWVEQNVKYDLTTTTADASQKSSWVLENKKGVCDELTSLFISLCRSLGIPARFVSGVSYSNVNLQNDGWGPHGWAEVYFPEAGWVPFDVTYKELGYVDATHITLKTSSDAKESSVEYSLLSQNSNVKPGSLTFNVDVTGKASLHKPRVLLSSSILQDEVGFGSFNLLKLTVKNPSQAYLAGNIYLSNVSELSILGNNKVFYALPPLGQKDYYWIIQVTEDLNPGYVYTFPLVASGDFGEREEVDFKASMHGSLYSEEYARSQIPDSSTSEKPQSKYLEAVCSAEPAEVYIGEPVKISCSLKSSGGSSLNLRVCLERNCTYKRLDAGSEARLEYTNYFSTLGIKTLSFKAESSTASKTAYVVVPVLDEPAVRIYNLTYPEVLDFDKQGEIRFWLKRDSSNIPKNVKVELDHDLMHEKWSFSAIENNYEIRFLFRGENLEFGTNNFKIRMSYEDAKGKKYDSEETFSIKFGRANILEKALLIINIIDAKLSNWVHEKI